MIFRRAQQLQEINNQLHTELAARKRAEEALSRKTHELSDFIEHANVGMHWVGPNGIIQWVNQAELGILGYTREEYIGHHIAEFHVDQPIIQDILERLNRCETLQDYAARLRCKDGSIKDVLISSSVFREDDKFVHSRCFTYDITERKRAEEAMRESRQRMELALNGAELGLWDIDIQTGHVVYNQRWAEMLGYTIEDIQPYVSSWENLVHPDDWPRVSALWNAHLAGDTALYQTDHRLRAKSGEWKWIQTYGKVLERDHDGKPLRALGIHLDINDRKRAEEALRESEERFHLLMSHALDAIFYIDLDGVIQWANHQAEVVAGRPRDQVIGHNITTLLSPETAAIAEVRLAAVRRGEAVTPLVEIEFFRPDGVMVWGEANIASVPQQGKTMGRLLVVRDITKRKRALEALRQSEEQQRQLLEDRDRISRDLHDNIIQMIYAVGLNLEECHRLIEDDPKASTRVISRAISALNAVIRDLRSYIARSEPKISSGQQLKAAIERLARTMEGAHLLEFRLQVDPMAASRLTAEEVNHVLYIVREAMSNSLRHSGGRSGFVALQSRNGYVYLEVGDDGVGFDVQAKQECGTGLRNLVARAEKLGAQLEVISKPGRGTRVVLIVPQEILNIPQESGYASARG